jgi:serine/threonine protein kinase
MIKSFRKNSPSQELHRSAMQDENQSTLKQTDGLPEGPVSDQPAFVGPEEGAGPPVSSAPEGVGSNSDTPQPGSSVSQSLPSRTMLGPYELLEKLGEGGMGAVFKARHTRLKKLVALKVMSPSAMRDPDAVARFSREMEAVGRLEHPNIVRALHADEFQGTHYLVMEYVEGKDLRTLVKQRGPLPVPEACRYLRQAAMALAYAHQHGLIHRDIKPSNLFVTDQGQVKVLDLGLARLSQNEAGEELTTTGVSLGTPDYMAPEQWTDTRRVDHRSDLYSAGCTLFYLLTGHVPYGGQGRATALSKMDGHANEEIPSLADWRSDVPPELNQLFQKLLAKRVAERLGTAAELARLLEPFCNLTLTNEPSRSTVGNFTVVDSSGNFFPISSSKPTIIVPDGESASNGLSATVGPVPETSRSEEPRRKVFAVVASLLGLAILGGAWMLLRQTDENPRASELQSPKKTPPGASGSAGALANGDTNAGDRTIDLIPLINAGSLGDGSPMDVAIESDVLTLDGSGERSPNLWVDFTNLAAADLTMRTQLRVTNRGAKGYAKLVFMADTKPELFALLIDEGDGIVRLFIDAAYNSRHKEDGIPLAIPTDGSFIELAYSLVGDRQELRVGGKLMIESPRPRHESGFVALGAGGWKVEMKQPQVILHKASIGLGQPVKK